MKYKSFTFWQYAPNAHEAGYINALSRMEAPCNVVCQNDIPSARKALGVTLPDYGRAKVLMCGNGEKLPDCVDLNNESDVHVFTGIRAFDLTKRAFSALRESKAKLVLVSESRNAVDGFRFARVLDSFLCERKIRNRVDKVFAMGALGVEWFKKTGYENKSVHEFCYTINSDPFSTPERGEKDDCFKVGYLGQLVTRKRVDLLLKAFSSLPVINKKLYIVGAGREKEALICKADLLLSKEKFFFRSPISNVEVGKFLSNVDVLVLPSDWDGWGAVVNEALIVGTPVVVSSHCGAAALEKDGVVEVFAAGDYSDLSVKLMKILCAYSSDRPLKSKVLSLASKIEGESVANYFLSCLDYESGPPPSPPWREVRL